MRSSAPKWLWACVVGVFAAGSIVLAQHLWKLNRSDWASWAQAVGSVLAVICALWIALREDRRRAREAKIVGRVTAAGLTKRLSVLFSTLEKGHQWATNAAKFDGSPDSFVVWQSRLAALRPISREDLLALIGLSEGCAFAVAGANDRLHLISETLSSLVDGKIRDSDARKECAQHVRAYLEEAMQALTAAWQECDAASAIADQDIRRSRSLFNEFQREPASLERQS